MFTDIPKTDEDHSNFPCWIPIVNKEGNRLKPIVRCQCGKYLGLNSHHVHPDGRVTAGFWHKKGNVYPEDPEGCEWHLHIRLSDYDWGEFVPDKK